jgi:hypothetical protein
MKLNCRADARRLDGVPAQAGIKPGHDNAPLRDDFAAIGMQDLAGYVAGIL